MILDYRPFGTIRNDCKLVVPQMIDFIEDLPDEWKDEWLKMKNELAESEGIGVCPDSHAALFESHVSRGCILILILSRTHLGEGQES